MRPCQTGADTPPTRQAPGTWLGGGMEITPGGVSPYQLTCLLATVRQYTSPRQEAWPSPDRPAKIHRPLPAGPWWCPTLGEKAIRRGRGAIWRAERGCYGYGDRQLRRGTATGFISEVDTRNSEGPTPARTAATFHTGEGGAQAVRQMTRPPPRSRAPTKP
ncbi:hypothetical protein AAFF_G00301480 [Aldrovandia affinis]|uniref:Uncharacterized protein n=1 Tax=Aldrovandia affinis TaxID=143900 RepID=A0AAD7WSC6_9TELE|nr:hypothetical protein AAFF_G00301480 [Aldrovandia affinis]